MSSYSTTQNFVIDITGSAFARSKITLKGSLGGYVADYDLFLVVDVFVHDAGGSGYVGAEYGTGDFVVLSHEVVVVGEVFHVLDAVAVHLFAEVLGDVDEFVVLGCFVYGVVECDVGFYDGGYEFGVDGFFEVEVGAGEFFFPCFGDAGAREFHGEFFDGHSHFEGVGEVFDGDVGYLGAAAGDHFHESLEFEHSDGFADRGTADTEFVCQVDFHKALAGLEFALYNCLSQCVKYHLPQGKVRIHIYF